MLYHKFNEVSSIVERFNRTLNQKLKIYFEINSNREWLTILPTILNNYSENTIHRTLGVPPAMVNKANEEEILHKMYSVKNFQLQKPVFKVGDRVRITRKKDTFSSKYEKNWSSEIFIISKIRYTDPITYSIRDLNDEEVLGHFYHQELQKTKF